MPDFDMVEATCEHEWKADMAGVDLKGGTATRFFHRCAKCGAAADEDGHCESCFDAESATIRREHWAVDTAEGDR